MGGINFWSFPKQLPEQNCPGESIFMVPRTNFYFVLGEMNFSLLQTKFLDVSFLSGGKARKTINLPHQTRRYLGPAESLVKALKVGLPEVASEVRKELWKDI